MIAQLRALSKIERGWRFAAPNTAAAAAAGGTANPPPALGPPVTNRILTYVDVVAAMM